MAYSSDILLPLAESPKSADMAIWPDLLDIYNSIHILAQQLNRVIQGSGDAGTPPWEAMPFTRYFYSPAAEGNIKTGNVVTIVNTLGRTSLGSPDVQYTGVVRGAPIYAGPLFSGRSENGQFNEKSLGSGLIGIALSDAEKDELVQVGVGPAILKVEGALPGDTIMAYQFGTFQGLSISPRLVLTQDELRGPFSNQFIPHGGMVVGYGVANDAVLFQPFLDYRADIEAGRAWNTPYAPVAGDSP